MSDSGKFIINDIELSIPPQQITIIHPGEHASIPTLRTRGGSHLPIKHSEIHIIVQTVFSKHKKNGSSGFEDLQNLVAQFRVTPFCYVENELLRKDILHGDRSRSMALALDSMTLKVSTQDGAVDLISVTMEFFWFNYAPYLPDFTFQSSLFGGGTEVKDPKDSPGWKLLYEAEKQRHSYDKQILWNDSSFALSINEFRMMNKSEYADQKRIVEGLKKVVERLSQQDRDSTLPDKDTQRYDEGNTTSIFSAFTDAFPNAGATEIRALISQTIGDGSSMSDQFFDNLTYEDLIGSLNKEISPKTTTQFSYYLSPEEWDVVGTVDGDPIVFKDNSGTQKQTGKDNQPRGLQDGDLLLVSRTHNLDSTKLGIIPIEIAFQFSNRLAMIPMSGQSHPSYQHMGGGDVSVSMKMVTSTEDGHIALTRLKDLYDEQALGYRYIPQGHRNIHIDFLPFLTMFGLRDFVINGLTTQTQPGAPGILNVSIDLLWNSINTETREDFSQEGSFRTRDSIRLKIYEGLVKGSLLRRQRLDLLTKRNFDLNKENQTIFTEFLKLFTKHTSDFLSAFGIDITSAISQLSVDLPGSLRSAGDRSFEETFKMMEKSDQESLNKILQTLSVLTLGTNEDLLGVSEFGLFFLQTYKEIFLGGQNANKVQENKTHVMSIKQGYIPDQTDSSGFDINGEQDLSSSLDKLIALAQKKYPAVTKTMVRDMLNEQSGTRAALDRWMIGITKLIDIQIMSNGLVFENREFKEAAKTLTDVFSHLDIGGYSYHDFPMEEVVNMLNDSDDAGWIEAKSQLLSIQRQGSSLFKGLSLKSLINPDFYIYSPINADISDLLSPSLIQKIGESSIASNKTFFTTERKWIGDVYERRFSTQRREMMNNYLLKSKMLVDKKLKDKSNSSSFVDQLWNSDYETTVGSAPILCSTLGRKAYQGTYNSADITWTPIPLQEDGEPTASGTLLKLRDMPVTQRPPDAASSAQHYLGLGSILEGESPINTGSTDNLSLAMPTWVWPAPPYVDRCTGPFGIREKHPVSGQTRIPHTGIDIAGVSPKETVTLPVFAAADGELTKVKTTISGREGVSIKIDHGNGWETRYYHLKENDRFTLELQNSFEIGMRKVQAGQRIGTMGGTGKVSGPHLHFEVRKNGTPLPFVRGSKYNDGKIYPSDKGVKSGDFISRSSLSPLSYKPGGTLLSKSVEKFASDLHSGQSMSLMRAYPAFKLYFIESDAGERKRYRFDDFFSYSAIQEIQVIKNANNPADLAIIKLTNISGVLTNRKFGFESGAFKTKGIKTKDQGDRKALDKERTKEPVSDFSKADTEAENPIASLMLQPGVEVQLRLGYSNNPEELEKVFNGVISEVTYGDNGDLVTILCQSYGLELVQTLHGKAAAYGNWITDRAGGSTSNLMCEMLAFPELQHFGRWEGYQDSISSVYGLLQDRFKISPQPQDDNVFAPSSAGVIASYFENTKYYTLYQQTIWDVAQELTLRHPAYISYPREYEDVYNDRMTMFFGVPDQLYFARSPDPRDQYLSSVIKEYQKDIRDQLSTTSELSDEIRDSIQNDTRIPDDVKDQIQRRFNSNAYTTGGKKNIVYNYAVSNEGIREIIALPEKQLAAAAAGERFFKDISLFYSLSKGIIRPFRNYHLLHSDYHIIENNIQSARQNTFNVCTLQYSSGGSPEADEDSRVLKFNSVETFTLECEAGLPDEDKRELYAQYPNCVEFEMAKRYGLSLLWKSLKEGYRGSVVMLGNPAIRPYDVCYLADAQTDMYGPFEVEQVVHKFSLQSGFVTEITPSMCLHVNQFSTLSSEDAMGIIAAKWMGKLDERHASARKASVFGATALANTAIAGSLASGNLLLAGGIYAAKRASMFVMRRLVTYSQMKHPFRATPLVQGGKPMLGGMPNRISDGSFIKRLSDGVEKWYKEVQDGSTAFVDDFVDNMNPNKWIGYSRGSLLNAIIGSGGKTK